MPRNNAAASRRHPDQESLASLKQTHGSLEQRLNELDRHRSLSPEEQFEAQVLKKRKLAIKDRIRVLQNGE